MKLLIVLVAAAVGFATASSGYAGPPVVAVHRPPVVVVATPVEQVNLPAAPEVVEPLRLRPLHPQPLVRLAPPQPFLPLVAPQPLLPVQIAAPSNQFHAQDELGGFSFGYTNVNSAKKEVRTPDGVTHGFYEYVDANNILQRVEYVADPVNGFRVAGTNIPVANGVALATADTAEVAAAKADFQRAFDATVARHQQAAAVLPVRRRRSAVGYPIDAPAPAAVLHAAPVVVQRFAQQPTLVEVSPVVPLAALVRQQPLVPAAAAPLLPVEVAQPSSQFHAQDEFGGVSFGYSNINSARQEERSPDGATRGSYSYVDGAGLVQTVHYVADALGFRVAGTNIPVAAS
jgi:hypothetical protein